MSKDLAHESLSRSVSLKAGSARSFGLTFTVVLVVIGLAPLLRGGDLRAWALAAAALLLLVSLYRPSLLNPLNAMWLAFGYLLARVTNPLVMGALFFLVFTPIAFFLRLTGKDPLRLRKSSGSTYWLERRPAGPRPDRMANQF